MHDERGPTTESGPAVFRLIWRMEKEEEEEEEDEEEGKVLRNTNMRNKKILIFLGNK